uniref:T6SS Transcription factor RovC-like DNA binding domain-containing protein n=1 Tax=Rhodopseudomonas palustris (strain DX-1) TaxID=652103 RepID=E6VPU3_RHOPX
MPTTNVTVVTLDAKVADEGLYVHFSLGTSQFAAICLDGYPPVGPVAAVALIDPYFQDRVDAINRFRDAALRRGTILDKRITPHRQRQLIEMLRTIDGRQAGATYQEIAEAVFGAAPVNAITWKSSSLRDTVMRRSAAGLDLVSGGYRRLLLGHRPNLS